MQKSHPGEGEQGGVSFNLVTYPFWSPNDENQLPLLQHCCKFLAGKLLPFRVQDKSGGGEVFFQFFRLFFHSLILQFDDIQPAEWGYAANEISDGVLIIRLLHFSDGDDADGHFFSAMMMLSLFPLTVLMQVKPN